MHRIIVLILVAPLLLASGCRSSEKPPDDVIPSALPSDDGSDFTGTQDVVVTRASERGPETCHPENVGRLVVEFFGAVNRRDPAQAVEFFTDDLGWYSITAGNPNRGGRHFVAYKKAKLRSYLEKRVDQGERMYLVSMDVAWERPGNVANVAYNMERTAKDLSDFAPEMGGKGAIDCDTGLISVWSMAQRKRPVPGKMCPGRPDPPRIALVCARDR